MLKYVALVLVVSLLSGCAAVLVGGGAAGGYYAAKNYNITKKSDSSQ